MQTIISRLSKVFRRQKREISTEPRESREPREPIRSTCHVRSIEFQCGQKLLLDREEVTVIVGPNNSGKSCTLREINSVLRNGKASSGIIVKTAELVFSDGNMASWVKNNSRINKYGHYLIEGINESISKYHLDVYWQERNESGLNDLTELFSIFLSTERRLSLFNDTKLPNYYEEVSTHPLHRIYRDPTLEQKLNEIFVRAFPSAVHCDSQH